jgi:hypothetical protein
MADAKRRGYGEDGIYFDHPGECRDGAWRGVISLGFNTGGDRIRKKVGGRTRLPSAQQLCYGR